MEDIHSDLRDAVQIFEHFLVQFTKALTRIGTIAALFLMLITLNAFADAKFQLWITNFRFTALQNGISPFIFDSTFAGVTTPDLEILEKAHYQPEFTTPVWDYIDNCVNENSIARGQAMARKWSLWLTRIENRFGIDRHILLAIWSVETNYGEILKRNDVVRDIIRSLATLAYADPPRAKYARAQLIAAMKILQSGDIDRSHLTGSWAGALGHTQFIPTSYQMYAVDIDKDGKRDIWTSVPDALATAANLLKKNGWETKHSWGYEVILPEGREFPSDSLSFSKWRSLGVVRANGKSFPRLSDKATLKIMDGRAGPAFLMIKNFFVIKRYNNADKYALAVGLLADRIAGYPDLIRDWNRPFTPISMKEREELQQRLQKLGYYDGNIDGKIGASSHAAIKSFQESHGLKPDGYPNKEVLLILRRQ